MVPRGLKLWRFEFSCPWYRPVGPSHPQEMRSRPSTVDADINLVCSNEDPRFVGGKLLMTSILTPVCAVALKARYLAGKSASHDAVYLDQMSSKSVAIAN